MNEQKGNINNLHGMAQFALFVSSYLPLFVLIIIKQVAENLDYFHWSGISFASISIFISKFGLSSILGLVSLFGWLGYRKTIGNLEEVAKNGYPVKVIDVKNKNSESIGYIATYIIPFLYQSFNNWYECFSILFLLVIIYRIYINSSLLLINPLLSFRFSIFEIEYEENGKLKNGLIITRDKYLHDDSNIKIYEVGHKLYYSITIN